METMELERGLTPEDMAALLWLLGSALLREGEKPRGAGEPGK